MNETVAAHIQKYGNGNHLWENEITSLLAQPLDASVYTSRELQVSKLVLFYIILMSLCLLTLLFSYPKKE